MQHTALSKWRGTTVAASIGIALLTGSQILLGYPQYVWFSLLVEGSFALLLAWRRGTWTWLLRLAAFKLAGLVVGAAQFLPTLEFAQQAQRQVAGAGSEGALHPLNLLQLVGPYLFADRVVGGNTHEFGLYFGTVPLLLVVWLLWRRKELGRKKWLATAALGFSLVAFIVALGEGGFLYKVQTWLPLVNRFRLPARYIVLVHLGLSVAAAVAFGDVVRAARQSQTCAKGLLPLRLNWGLVLLASAIAVGGVGLCVSFFIEPVGGQQEALSPWMLLLLVEPLLLAAACAIFSLSGRGIRWAPLALAVLTAVDLGTYGLSYAALRGTYPLGDAVAAIPIADTKHRIATDIRKPGDNSLRYGNQGALAGWRQIDGYAGLEPVNRLNYGNHSALAVAGVKTVVDSDANWLAVRCRLKPGPGSLWIPRTDLPVDHWLVAPLPYVRLVAVAQTSADPAADLSSIDIASTALVDEPLALSGGARGEATLVSELPGHLKITTNASQPRLLVVAERFHPGWKATVDGQLAAVLRVNGDFQGCVVPAGNHTVKLRFAPWSVWLGRWLSLAGLIGLTVYGLGAWILRVRRVGRANGNAGGSSVAEYA